MGVFADTSPKSVFGCKTPKPDNDHLEKVDCFVNLQLPVPPTTTAGTRYIVTGLSGIIHPTWINLPSGLEENDIIEKDFQNLNWLLATDISEEPCGGGGLIVYVECKCYNYWFNECEQKWCEISPCAFWGELELDEFCPTVAGQTGFTLGAIAQAPEKSILTVNGVDYVYGTNYTISGTALTWLNDPFELDPCDLVQIRYC